MKLRIILSLVLVLIFHSTADASRISEIEEYYVKKASDYLKTRFPDKPFTVFAKVYTDGKNTETRKAQLRKKSNDFDEARLPYLGSDELAEEIDFWSRTDLSLATLISQLDKVEIKIRIDSSITDEELNELKASISEQLKLVPQTDMIELEKMDWTKKELSSRRWWLTGGILASLAIVFAMMLALSKLSVRHLIKGLEQPLSELGKSTQAFANNALNVAADAQYQGNASSTETSSLDTEDLNLGTNLLELRKSGLELLERNKDLLEKPDAEVMDFFERHGSENPRPMGAILAELDNETLRNLFKFGQGTWWYVALSQPMPMNQHSLKILNELDRLRLRRNFDTQNETSRSDDYREAGLIFGRLNAEQLAQVFQGTKIEEAQIYFDILPRALALAIGKTLYPGQWAALLTDNKKTQLMEAKKLQAFKEKALQMLPLRKEEEIQNFFRDLDLVRYLDVASYRDEREFYMVLPEDSRIKRERMPYFKVLEAESDAIKLMGPDLNVKEWTHFLSSAEPNEREKFYNSMASRLAYLVKEEFKRFDYNNVDSAFLRLAKKKAQTSYQRAIEVVEWKNNNEKTTEKTTAETLEDKAA